MDAISVLERHSWHTLSVEQAVADLGSDVDGGLAAAEARRRLERYGPNALAEPTTRSMSSVFVHQFKSPLIYLLFVAAAIALLLGHTSDSAVILGVVLLNALIGTFQEGRAERSLAALRRLTSHKARVVRGAEQTSIDARDLVPGDILVLEAGDAVTADARLLQAAALQMGEAPLTGESAPVAKDLLPLPPDTPLADRRNMVYAGTHVTAGRARAVVCATASTTEIGQIAALAEAAEEPRTPLEHRIAQLGRTVIVASLVLFGLILVIGFLRGIPGGEILMLGISQLVGMIPEGLPVAMTIALAVGVQRMARRRTVVRRLAAVETLGSTTVICTDKTGTLTRNEMTATALHLPGGPELTISGVGYAPEGGFFVGAHPIDPSRDSRLRELVDAGALCNDAQLQGPADDDAGWKAIGDPTEVALLTLAIKSGTAPEELRRRSPRLAEIPFDPAIKMMATQHATAGGSRVIVKGAPEVVLDLCRAERRGGQDAPLDEAGREALRAAVERMAGQTLRVLAVAEVDRAEIPSVAEFSVFRGRATLLGLIGQMDPPRPEVRDAVARCREAGIRPVMVTGDHKATGHAIARALGIALPRDETIDGRELDQLSDTELTRRIERISVFARVHPAQKLRIVEAFQRHGEVVAMTGDGVNDAPALVKADVGVAMGRTGTEVAKEAAKIVIGDDNFATIVSAVEEGRIVYRNIQNALLLLLSTSAAEVVVLLLALLMGYPPPFVAVQILWNNLVTEGIITVNLVMDPAEGDEMRRRPIRRSEPLLTRNLLTRMAFMVPCIAVSTLGWFLLRTASGVSAAQARTETFTLLAICEWFNVLNCRSERKSALTFGLFRNPWLVGGLIVGNLLQVAVVFWSPLGRLFHTAPFSLREVVALGIVGSLVLWVEEARKLFVRQRS